MTPTSISMDVGVVSFVPVDISDLAGWILAIDFDEWPQQTRLSDGHVRPAMVTDLDWHQFGVRTDTVVADILNRFPQATAYQRMLSVVMPGHRIPPHVDQQGSDWLCRVHIPLATNVDSHFIVAAHPYELAVGMSYRVNTKLEHAVTNDGDSPRIHFMFDVRS